MKSALFLGVSIVGLASAGPALAGGIDRTGFSLEAGVAAAQRDFKFDDVGKPSRRLSGAVAQANLVYMKDFGTWVLGGSLTGEAAKLFDAGFDGDFIEQQAEYDGAVGANIIVGKEVGDGLFTAELGPEVAWFGTGQTCRNAIPRGYCSRAGAYHRDKMQAQQGFKLALAYQRPLADSVSVGLRVSATQYKAEAYDLGEDGVGGQVPRTTSSKGVMPRVGIFVSWHPGQKKAA